MKKNLDLFERAVRIIVAAVSFFLGTVAFTHPVAKLFFVAFGAWAAYEAAMAVCPLYRHLGMEKVGERLKERELFLLALLGTQLTAAYVWMHAGYEKIGGDFAQKLPDTLAYFASKNPYPFMKTFLLGSALPKAGMIGPLVEWGQVATGLALAAAVILIAYGKTEQKRLGYALSIVALFAGAVMNAAFWLAAGWTGPGTATANIAMLWPGLLFLYVWKVKYLETR